MTRKYYKVDKTVLVRIPGFLKITKKVVCRDFVMIL